MKLRSWASIGALMGASIATGSAMATGSPAPEPLSLEQALAVASDRSFALRAQDLAASAAREKAIAAARRPDPVGRLAIENLPVDGDMAWSPSRDFMTMRTIGINQELTSRGRLDGRRVRFERIGDTEEAIGRLRLSELRRATARAWLARVYADKALEMNLDLRREILLQVEAADATYRGGQGRQTDPIAARASLAAIENAIREAESKRETAAIELARWVGAIAHHPLTKPPSISVVALSQGGSGDAILDHPMIAVLEQRHAVARATVDLARAERHPDWRIGLYYSQRGSAFSNMASISLSVPLPWNRADLQDRELSAALAIADQRKAELDEQARELDAQTRALRAIWRSGLDRLGRFDRSLIPLAVEQTRAALSAYRSGEASLEAVLAARRAEIDRRLERLRLEADTADKWAQLEFLSAPDATSLPQDGNPTTGVKSR